MNDLSCSHKGHLWKSLFRRIYEAFKTRQRFLRMSTTQKHQPLLSYSLLSFFIAQGDRYLMDQISICLSSQDQKSVPLSVICVTWFLKSKVDFHCTSLAYKSWYVLAQAMAPLHFFLGHSQGQVLFPYSFLHAV